MARSALRNLKDLDSLFIYLHTQQIQNAEHYQDSYLLITKRLDNTDEAQ